MINWNPLVNQKFSLDGEYGLSEDFTETIEFESGKKREHLKNTFIPYEFTSISLTLDDNKIVTTGVNNTEFKQFVFWHDITLRYGTLPFTVKKLNGTGNAVYKFTGKPKYDRAKGIIIASFGLREE